MSTQEVWNLVAIATLLFAVGYNAAYVARHKNGKHMIRGFSVLVLLVVAALRVSLALHVLPNEDFQDLLRPWSNLVYLLPVMDAYVDWKRHA